MLDAFLETLYEHDKQASIREELVAEMKKLPNEELHKIARCGLGFKYDSSGCWLDQFKDTPLYQEALAIEEQDLKLEIEEQQERAEDRQRRDATWNARDALCVKKRLLELELRKQQSGAEQAPPISQEPDEPVEDVAEKMSSANLALMAAAMRKQATGKEDKGKLERTGEGFGTLVGIPTGAILGARAGEQLGHYIEPTLGGPVGMIAGGMAGLGAGPYIGRELGGAVGRLGDRGIERVQMVGKKKAAQKVAAVLTTAQRDKVKPKNFAVPKQEKYPIPDPTHARNALTRVRQFGSPKEKAQVFAAVAKKYPALATRSEVIPPKLQRKAEKKVGVGKGEESQKKEKAVQKVASMLTASQVTGPDVADAWGRKMAQDFSKEALSFGAVASPFKALGKGVVKAVKGGMSSGISPLAAKAGMTAGAGAGLGAAAKNVGALGMQWAKSNPLHAAGLAGGAGLAAGGMLGRATAPSQPR